MGLFFYNNRGYAAVVRHQGQLYRLPTLVSTIIACSNTELGAYLQLIYTL